MKKFFTLLTLLFTIVGGANSVWGASELVYHGATDATISGTTYTSATGLTLVQSNSKELASGKNITVNSAAYTSFKLSTGSRNFTVTAPSGKEITAITIYSYENNSTPEGGAFTIVAGTEISNTAGTTFTKGSNDNATPDVQKFVFAPASSIQFSWTGKQNCCVLEVEYFNTSDSKYTLTTAANPSEGKNTIVASRQYYSGSTAFLNTTPADGYVFSNWTNESSVEVSASAKAFVTMPASNVTYTANFTSGNTHTITAEIADGQSTYGSITNAGANVVVENEEITFAATANEGYAFINWTSGGSVYSTNASITVTSTADATYTANFKKLFRVTYDKSNYIGDINSSKILSTYTTSVNEKYADKNDSYTIPAYADLYFHRDGYTFDKWSDGNGNYYDSGDVIVSMTADVTLTPTWATVTESLSNSQNKNIVTWSFAKSNIIFADWQSSDYGYYVQKAIVNGETVSLPMQIVNGKVGNYNRSDDLAQTNQNTKFTIPAVSGMVVEIPDAYTNLSTTTIAGSTSYTGTGTKSISYTYTGDASTIDIVIGENNQYLKRIVVTYPVTAANVTISPAKEYTTYVTEAPLDFTGIEGLKAYIATAVSESNVQMTRVNKVPAGTGLVLKTSGSSFDVPVFDGTGADNVSGNKMAGSATATTAVAANAGYILKDGVFQPSSEGNLPAGKAYLNIAVSGARELTMSFEDDDVTGIQSIENGKSAIDNSVYDLSGRRVAQPTNGLYIVNGKKVVIK